MANRKIKRNDRSGMQRIQYIVVSSESIISGSCAGEFSPILNSGVVLSVISLSFTGTKIARNFSPTFVGFPSKVSVTLACCLTQVLKSA